jgi:hypothetical protein
VGTLRFAHPAIPLLDYRGDDIVGTWLENLHPKHEFRPRLFLEIVTGRGLASNRLFTGSIQSCRMDLKTQGRK